MQLTELCQDVASLHHIPSFVEKGKNIQKKWRKRSRQRTRKKRKGQKVWDAADGTRSGCCKPCSTHNAPVRRKYTDRR